MSVYRRGKTWWYSFRFRGRRYRRSTGFTNRQRALQVEASVKIKLLESEHRLPGPQKIPTLQEFSKEFLEYVERNQARATFELQRANVGHLGRYFKGRRLDDITKAMVEEFKWWMSRRERQNARDHSLVGPATVNKVLKTGRRLYNYAIHDREVRISNPFQNARLLKESEGRMRVLTNEEMERYLKHAPPDLRDFSTVIFETGLRPDEAYRLHKQYLHAEGPHPYIHNPWGKTRAAKRDVPLTKPALDILRRRAEESPNGYLFWAKRARPKNPGAGRVGSYKKAHETVMRKVFTEDPWVMYDLRHSFGTAMGELCDLPTLAALMGHTDIKMTMRYIHPLSEAKGRAIGKLETTRKRARPALAQAVEEEEWTEVWDPERQGMRLVRVVEEPYRPQNRPQIYVQENQVDLTKY